MINFPTGIDDLPNPTANTKRNAPGFGHAEAHCDIADAIGALESKLGVNNSLVTTSIDFRIRALESAGVSGSVVGGGSEDLVEDEIEHEVATMGAASVPAVVAPFMIIPPGGEFIDVRLVSGTKTEDGFLVIFNQPIPGGGGYEIGWSYKL